MLSPLHQIQTSPLSSLSSEAGSEPGKSPAKERLIAPIPAPRTSRNMSPLSSDSEPETRDKSNSQPPKSPRMIKRGLESRIKKFEKRRESESSMSEDSIPASPKSARLNKKLSSPDIRTPTRFLKPLDKSYSVDEVSLDDRKRAEGPTPPPRPHRAELSRLQPPNIPRITEDLLSDSPLPSSSPNRPVRPRVSEIRRAKEKSRGNRMDVDGDTDASSVFSVSSKSSSEISSKPHHRKIHKKMSTIETPSTSLLPPANVPRRRKSTSDADIDEAGAPPLSAPPQAPPTDAPAPAVNPLSQQMADTLIKYILSSEDPGLKNALRQIITNDPQVLQAVQNDSVTEKQGTRAPTPPKRPY